MSACLVFRLGAVMLIVALTAVLAIVVPDFVASVCDLFDLRRRARDEFELGGFGNEVERVW